MGLYIQPGLAGAVDLKEVWYDGAGGAVKAGYVVCYDDGEHTSPQTGEFDELQRFRVVQKPETANLEFFAGIVVDPLRTSGTNAGPIVIAVPRRGQAMKVLCKVNATIKDPLCAINGEWHLGADANAATATSGAGAAVNSRRTVGLAGETADTSTTAADKLVYFV